jgi:hypothetical protein
VPETNPLRPVSRLRPYEQVERQILGWVSDVTRLRG